MKEYSSKEERVKAVKALWYEWIVSFGAVTVAVAISVMVGSGWLALLVAAIAWVLNVMADKHKRTGQTGCMRYAHLTARALFISALIMVAISILFKIRWVHNVFGEDTVNTNIPYIASLIIFPTMCVVCLYGLARHGKSRFCRACKEVHGYSPEEGFVGNFFHHETRRQLRLMAALSALISLTDWFYYFYFYKNANINTPDKFFFVGMPLAVYIFSLIHAARHYYIIQQDIIRHAEGIARTARNKILRYLIVRNDMLLLDVGEHNLLDTPAETPLEEAGPVSDSEARRVFRNISGSNDDFALQQLYSNRSKTYRSTFVHYLVNLPGDGSSPLPADWKFKGEWATLPVIDRLMKAGMIAPALGAEIHRVYTIAMAWKTYGHDGRRLYPIKNYRPTFRLRDIASWDVDFNDTSWFDVASNNQDKPFWRLRRLWHRTTRLPESPAMKPVKKREEK